MSDKLLLTRDGEVVAKYLLETDRVVIGAAADCGIRVDDPDVQERHAVLKRVDGLWRVHALDPRFPILCDDGSCETLDLPDGATFRLGGAGFAVQHHLAAAAPAAAPAPAAWSAEDLAAGLDELRAARTGILAEVGRVIIGQQAVLEQLLTALFARGHCLLVGVPGLAKTLMVRTLAETLDLDTRRVQFTPDLMPSDITGTDILDTDADTGRRSFRFNKGPVFTNLLLADEINRTPPKTQAALLEAMQESRVTASGITYTLPQPFFVLATQNPIELEGTYPLPEAQLDRFMFAVRVEYPTAEEEPRILLETTRDAAATVARVLDAGRIVALQHLVRNMPVSAHVAGYAAALVRASRPGQPDTPDFIARWVRWGAGPRAGQYLLLAAKAHAALEGRCNVACSDVRRYALPVLRHRLFCNFAAASEGVSADDVVQRLLDHVREPAYGG